MTALPCPESVPIADQACINCFFILFINTIMHKKFVSFYFLTLADTLHNLTTLNYNQALELRRFGCSPFFLTGVEYAEKTFHGGGVIVGKVDGEGLALAGLGPGL